MRLIFLNLKSCFTFLTLLLVFPSVHWGQQDSLWNIWKDSNKEDTTRLIALDKIIWNKLMLTNPDSAYVLADQQYEFAKEKKLKHYVAWALNSKGVASRLLGNYRKAIAYTLENIKLQLELGNQNGLASAYNNLGLIYFYLENNEKAIDAYEKSLAINEEINDSKNIALNLGNIALLHYANGDLEKALKFNLRSLQIREKIGDRHGMAIAMNNIGNIYQSLKNYDNALDYYDDALKIYLDLEDLQGLSNNYNNIGSVYLELNDLKNAFQFSNSSLSIAKQINAILDIRNAANTLYQIYKKENNYKKALEMHELYLIMKDSIVKKENQNEILNQEYRIKFTLDSLRIEDEKLIMSTNLQLKDVKIQQGKTQRYYLIGGLLTLFLFIGFVYNRYLNSQKQNAIIETKKIELEIQKEIIEKRQKEVSDSIKYAKRLQDAILPDYQIIQQYFEDFFLIYRPKDVVSGDFYWLEKKDDLLFIAVADCTGHGVPGALVSVVCHNMLNRAVNEFQLTNPAAILNKTRELVIETFAKKGDVVSDGMDIALCVFDIKNNQMQYAGANNAAWIVRKNDIEAPTFSDRYKIEKNESYALLELKATKQPIGNYPLLEPFSNLNFELQKNDCIYLFSDGFADQFGGNSGKKLMSKPFKRILLKHQELNMKDQANLLIRTFENWKGSHEQVDDICILGIKI